jgi:tetratricopeptide (TPR) repeat protein
MNELDFSEISKLSEKYNKDPQSRIFVQLADVYRKNNMVDEALDVLNKGLEYHPQYALAYLVLGKCYFDKRAHIQARDSFEKTLALDPQNVVALRMLARTYEMLKDEKGQINAYKNIIAIDPLDTNAKEKLSMLEALQRKEPMYTVAMAEEYEKQGNIEESLKIYENLLFTDPGDLILKEKVAELKKIIEEKKRKIEEEKIKDMQIEPVFKPQDLVKEDAPQQVKTPMVSPHEGSERTPTAEEGIQSLEDFLVEELEQAAEKVATQRGEEKPAQEIPPAPKQGARTEEVTVQPSRQDADIIALSSDSEDTSVEITQAHEMSFGDIALEQKPTEEMEAAGLQEEKQPSAESKEPAHTVQPPQPEVTEPIDTETPTEPTTSETPASGPKDEEEKSEPAKKPDEEDFKSFQDWLSGLLK